MRNAVYGTCALCRDYKLLLRSHYIGRSVQRIVQRLDQGGQIILTPKVITADNRQIWRNLFCRDSEGLFNRRGETPVLKLVNRAEDFPLLKRLNLNLKARTTQENHGIYSAADIGVDTEALAYYALSLMFKGSVCKWRTIEDQTTSINLQEFQEPIRRYLLGQAAFPEDLYVIFTVCTDFGSQMIVWFPFLVNGLPYRMYEFVVLGLCFYVITQ